MTAPAASRTLILGTRASRLALAQSRQVADALQAHWPDLTVQLRPITTGGDRIQDRPLQSAGGKGLFTSELELALLNGQVDLVVHSFKDVPVTEPLVPVQQLVIAAVPPRVDVRDVLICRTANSLGTLPHRARLGTASLRRRCQTLALRPDLLVHWIRGNVDTRLAKLDHGDCDAIILALAGLQRAKLFDPIYMFTIPPDEMLPAAGQGALALQCRADRQDVRDFLAPLDDPATRLCVNVERELVRQLHGDCHSPIAAWALRENDTISLRAAVGQSGGEPPVRRAAVRATIGQADALAAQAADILQAPL